MMFDLGIWTISAATELNNHAAGKYSVFGLMRDVLRNMLIQLTARGRSTSETWKRWQFPPAQYTVRLSIYTDHRTLFDRWDFGWSWQMNDWTVFCRLEIDCFTFCDAGEYQRIENPLHTGVCVQFFESSIPQHKRFSTLSKTVRVKDFQLTPPVNRTYSRWPLMAITL